MGCWMSAETKFDPRLCLDFRHVLGDALCDERRLACRLPRVTPWRSRHRVRPELVHVLRNPAGTAVAARVGRGGDIAGTADLLRPAGHGSVRSCRAGRAADLGAVGRQHHGGARRSRQHRSGPSRRRRCGNTSRTVCSNASVSHDRARRARRLEPLSQRTQGQTSKLSWTFSSTCGEPGKYSMRSIRTCRGTRKFGQHGPKRNAWRRAHGPSH